MTDKEKKAAEAKEQPAAPVREDIFIPRGAANDDPNLYVSINGVNYVLPKGKTSNVPKFVADEIRRSWKAQEIFDQHREAMLEASKK